MIGSGSSAWDAAAPCFLSECVRDAARQERETHLIKEEWAMKGGTGRFKGRYDLFTVYLIPGTTVFLASLDSWTDTNLSVLGNTEGNKLLFFIWGFTTGIYYCVYIRYLFHIGRYRNTAGRWLMYTAAAFLLASVMIPYMPEKYPLKADLHVLLAFFAPVLLAFCIVRFLRFLSSRDRRRYRRAWNILWTLTSCAFIFILEAGFITSFLEIFVVTGLCGYLRYMERLLVTA